MDLRGIQISRWKSVLLFALCFTCSASGQETAPAPATSEVEHTGRCSLWIDLYSGEPTTYQEVIADLQQARVVYLGEAHTLQRHHDLQAKLFADLAEQDVPLVLALEQLPTSQQEHLDRYNRQEIGFDELAELTNWKHHWSNYRQYRSVLEAARNAGAPVIALNASPRLIREIARGGGVARLPVEAREQLPDDMRLEDPLYEKLLKLSLMVHMAASPERLRPMIEAQIARDEVMAATLSAYLKSEQGRKRTAVVLCGTGHVAYGLGTAGRVRRRIPEVRDRIVLFSQSGDVELSPEEKAVSRDVEITHEQLREIDRPIGDYLHATELAPADSARSDGDAGGN